MAAMEELASELEEVCKGNIGDKPIPVPINNFPSQMQALIGLADFVRAKQEEIMFPKEINGQFSKHDETLTVSEPSEQFYIMWNPESDRPPTVRFDDIKHAERVAQDMIDKGMCEEVFVLEAKLLVRGR
jgi:hypothetical protein